MSQGLHGQRQEAAKNNVDLPEDDPALFDLLVQCFYETDYNPKLPARDSQAHDSRISLLDNLDDNRFYNFSYMCRESACPKNLLRVCSHHEFHAQMRNNECINLVCKECCSDYSPPLRPVLRGSDQLVLHAQMYQMSNKYCIVEFEGLTCEKFACACAKIWDTEDFAPTLYIVLSTTPEQGQDIHSVAAQVLNDYLASPSALSSAYSSQRWSPSGVLILI